MEDKYFNLIPLESRASDEDVGPHHLIGMSSHEARMKELGEITEKANANVRAYY
jgi:hypothetical protein